MSGDFPPTPEFPMSDIVERPRADADAIQRFGEERHGFINYETIPANAREAADEIERLRNFLGIACDDYEDQHGKPTRATHWLVQARAALADSGMRQAGTGEER